MISGRNFSCFDQNHRPQIHNDISKGYLAPFHLSQAMNRSCSVYFVFEFVIALGFKNSSIGNKMRFLKSNLEERALTT